MFEKFIRNALMAAVLTPTVALIGCSESNESNRSKSGGSSSTKLTDSTNELPESKLSALPESPLKDPSKKIDDPLNPAGQSQNRAKGTDSQEFNENSANYQEKYLNQSPPVSVDESLLQSNGIMKIEGKFLDVFTDVRDSKDIAEFPRVFEKAIRHWCEFFDIPPDDVDDWKMTAFVIKNKQAFIDSKILTGQLPAFASGFQKGSQIWMFVQPGEYYTRHLLLHEGTHAFMERFLRGYGAPWYSEGMAELLAVHRWDGEELTMQHRLRDRSEAPYWGRVRIIQDAFASKSALQLEQVITFKNDIFYSASKPYAWSWAACYFLSQHPLSRDAFASLKKQAALPPDEFNSSAMKTLGQNWKQLVLEWQVFVANMEYGYDVDRNAITDVSTVAADSTDSSINKITKIDVAKGWQRSEIEVKPGFRYIVRSWGQFQIAVERNKDNGKAVPWKSETQGVTIEYYKNRPLGALLAAVESVDDKSKATLIAPESAHSRTLVFDRPGRLCFRINDSAARMDDNRGTASVEVRVLPPAKRKPPQKKPPNKK